MADNKQYGPLTSKQTTASDIRSVIANSTKKSGKGYTIATKEEITEAKQKKEQPKTIKSISVKGGLNNTVMQNAIKNNGIKVAPDTSTTPKVYSPEYQQTKMQEQVINTPTPVNPNTSFSVQMKTVGNNGRMGSYSYDNAVQYFNDNTIDTNSALYQLNEDITSIVNEGRSGDYNPGHIKQYYWEFSALDDSVMEELMSDLANNHLGQELTGKDIQGIYSKYPELNLIRKGWFRGYDGNTQKVSGGVRGWANNISRNFSTAPLEGEQDENGFVGMADKANVFGNLGTRLDQFAQNTFQVQGSEGAEKIKNVLINMTDDDMRRMWNKYVQWVNKNPDEAIAYVKNNGGPEKIQPLFGSVKFTTEEIAPAFQNWVIDQINKEQNGFWGEVMNKGANFKKDAGPNDLQKLDDATLGKAREWLSEGGEAAKELRENTDNNALKALYGTAEVATRVAQGAAYLPRFITDFATESFWDANKEEVLANLPGSAVKGVTTMVNAATNWYDTAVGIGKLFATEEGANVLKEMYGSEENVTKSFQRDPVGTLMDVFGAAEAITHMTSAAVKASKMVPGATYVAANMIGADRLAKMSKNILDVLDEASKSLTAKGNTLGSISDLGITDLHRGLMNKIQAYLKQGSKPGFWNKAVRAGAWYTAITQDTLGTLKLLAGSNNHSLQELGRLAQQIVQGDSKTGEAFIRAKDSGYIDTEGVKDYAGLQEKIKEGESRYGKDIESALGGEEGVVNKENTNQKTDEGTEYNRYQDAIDGLKELYEKTGDYDALDAIKKLEQKFNGEGLTKLETKKLISEYGREFNSKGWGKNGEPLTSQSAEKVQNTKVGMNEWLKENLSEAAKQAMENIDRNYGDLKSVEKAVNKVLKSLDNMGKKISGETVTSKIGNFVGGTAAVVGAFTDIIGGRGIGTILGLISKSVIDKMTKRPKNLPLKDVQAQLSKNIKKFDKMLTSLNKRYTSVGAAVLATSMKNQGVIDEKTYNKIIEKLNPNLKEDVKPRESIKNKNGLEQKSGGELRNDIIEEVNKAIDIEDIKDIREVVDNFKNKLTEDDIKAINDAIKDTDIEYNYAQSKARSKAGDKEDKLTKGDEKVVIDWVKNHANNPGYVIRLLDETGMMKAMAEAGDKAQKGIQGFKDPYNKYLNLMKNPTDTTAQHEFFHAVFEVVDAKTKKFLINEVRKILDARGMDEVAAEEWLAESFGIYAKRKMFDAGLLKGKGWTAKLERIARDFFQRVYEWIQNFNGDRKAITEIFNTIYEGKVKIGEDGLLDLSYLLKEEKGLGDKGVKVRDLGDNGLRKKSVYHGSPADFDKFDSSHMGEGEGNQAHGWGHYVAVEERTGRHYADMGGEPSFEYNGKKIWDLKGAERKVADSMEINITKWDYDFEESKSELKERYENGIKSNKERLLDKGETDAGRDSAKREIEKYKEMLKVLDKMDENNFVLTPNKNLYNLDIPDPKKADTPTGSNYLEEKGVLTKEQRNNFYEKLDKIHKGMGDDLKRRIEDWINKKYEKGDGETFYHAINEWLDENNLGGEKETSKLLNDLGYDGIHYYGGRDGEAYVIFNDDALQIKDHIRYKKKIGDKEVEINKDITSPNKMVKINDKGYSVIKQFISEKQAEKALDVSKELLDNKGNPYMWTHTNKYNSEQFANFINTKDSKYKEFTDNEIAWFTNNEDMSKSYGNWDSILANTKPYKSVSEFNNQNTKVEKSSGEQTTRTGIKIPTESENTIGTKIIEKDGKYNVVQVNEGKFTLDTTLDNLLDDMGIAKEGYMPDNETKHTLSRDERIERVKWEFAGSYSWGKWDVDIKELPNGKVEVTRSWNKTLGKYDSEKAALAEYTASKTGKSKYHYQGIIQNIKNPLVVDIKGEGDNLSFWNKLGNAYDFLKKSDEKGLKSIENVQKKFDDSIGKYVEKRKELDNAARDLKTEYYNRIKDDRLNNPNLTDEERNIIREENIWKGEEFSKALSVQYGINQMLFGYENDLKPNQIEFINTHQDFKKIYDDAKTFLEDNKEMRNIVERPTEKDLMNWAKKNGLDNATAGLFHGMWIRGMDGFNFITELKRKELQTNDYVFYALNKGGYDGVLFKGITDYGHEPKGGWGMAEAGDVLAAFHSKDFKAWDNSNPTDSKYISYKKKVSLDKKSEGLQKKNSSGLLAKGRERTLGNDGLRYKTNISDKDSSGKKLSEGQKKFFAGSKVVDKDGNLLRVYHGTVAGDFTVFQKYGNRTSNNIASDVGFWFTPNKKGAINFAKESSWRGDNKARAEEVYLDIKNPKIYEPSEFNLKDYEERDKLIDSKYKEVYAARNEMNKYDYNHFWMGEYTHGNHVNRGIFNKLEYIYDQKGKITEADLKDIKEEYGKINWDGYYKPDIDATYEDFKNYLQAKKQYDKLNDEYLKMKHSDSYDDFKADIYKLDNKKRDKLDFALDDMDAAKKYIDNLKKEGYDGIIIKGTEYDGATLGEGARNDQYVAFDSNQIKRITNENPTKNDDIRYKKVYHGGGDFDKFDLSHAGEGEGNTAHGWGVYVTENQARAKEYGTLYRNNKYGLGLWGGNGQFVTYKGKKLPELNGENSSLIGQIIQGMQNKNDANPYYSAESQIARVKRGLTDQQVVWQGRGLTDKSTKETLEKKIKFLDGLDPKDFKIEDAKRNLYEVDVPDMKKAKTPTGTNYIEEAGLITNEAYREINKKLFNETGKRMFSWSPSINGKKLYERLTNVLGSEKQASEFLNDMGYDGIHYIGKEDGSSYVLFDDKTPQIKNTIRYKKGLTAKDQTQTPEFKKWFEGSKVVNEDGTPKIMYHGTPNKGFNIFNEGYFTENKDYADKYKSATASSIKFNKKADNPGTYAVYLDIKNPFDTRDSKARDIFYKEYTYEYGNGTDLSDRGLPDWTDGEYLHEFLQEKHPEYDGLILDEGGEFLPNTSIDENGFYGGEVQDRGISYKPFKPNQIKSATDNIGTFDKNNPDIRYKKGLEKKENGLERKKVSTASSFQSRVDNIANELGVKGGNTVQKMKRINKIIKEDKYKGTDIKKRFYQLKWEYKKQYIINNDKKIKDKGFKRTTLRVWQNGKKADWHFTKKQYEELKELGYIE